MKKGWLKKLTAKLRCWRTFPSWPSGQFVTGGIAGIMFVGAGILWKFDHDLLAGFVATLGVGLITDIVIRGVIFYSERKVRI